MCIISEKSGWNEPIIMYFLSLFIVDCFHLVQSNRSVCDKVWVCLFLDCDALQVKDIFILKTQCRGIKRAATLCFCLYVMREGVIKHLEHLMLTFTMMDECSFCSYLGFSSILSELPLIFTHVILFLLQLCGARCSISTSTWVGRMCFGS